LEKVRLICRWVDGELSWILTALSDTDCRMAELVKPSKARVRLDGDILYMSIRSQP